MSTPNDLTTNQDENRGGNHNPQGKGGFGDNPQNRSDGRWSKDNSFTYWLNFFKSLSVEDFLDWEKNVPTKDRSVAASLSYARVANAREDLKEFAVVADRTEGRAVQAIDVTSLGEQINSGHDQLKEIAEAIKYANRDSKPNDPAAGTDGLDTATQAS